MKQNILLVFLFLCLNSFAQNLVKYKIDENVSLDIPEGYEELESSGQMFARTFVGKTIVLISKSSAAYSGVEIHKESQLIDYYEGIQNGILKTPKGKLKKENIIEINGLKALKTSSEVVIENEKKIFDHYIFLLKGITYSVQFIHSNEKDEGLEQLKQKIISSISFVK